MSNYPDNFSDDAFDRHMGKDPSYHGDTKDDVYAAINEIAARAAAEVIERFGLRNFDHYEGKPETRAKYAIQCIADGVENALRSDFWDSLS